MHPAKNCVAAKHEASGMKWRSASFGKRNISTRRRRRIEESGAIAGIAARQKNKALARSINKQALK